MFGFVYEPWFRFPQKISIDCSKYFVNCFLLKVTEDVMDSFFQKLELAAPRVSVYPIGLRFRSCKAITR